MGNTKRDQQIRCNCSWEEKVLINQRIAESGLNKNDYIINAILSDYKPKLMNAAIYACRVSDQMNLLEVEYPQINFTPMRKEVDLLCQQLL